MRQRRYWRALPQLATFCYGWTKQRRPRQTTENNIPGIRRHLDIRIYRQPAPKTTERQGGVGALAILLAIAITEDPTINKTRNNLWSTPTRLHEPNLSPQKY